MTQIERVARTSLPTEHGEFSMIVYKDQNGLEHIALTVGNLESSEPVLVRMHSECLTGDVFGSHRCDCGEQLDDSLRTLQEQGRGVLLYLRQEGRGIGLTNKIKAYALQDQGLDTVEANLALGLPEDARDYGCAAAMLRDLGITRVRLITNNPTKIAGLTDYGIDVVEREPVMIPPHAENLRYLDVKRDKMGHMLPGQMSTLHDHAAGIIAD